MMREIVDHQYSSDFAPQVHPTPHAAKGRERLGDCLGRDAATLSHDERCHGVQDVMPPRGGQRELPKQLSMMRDLKPHNLVINGAIARHPIRSEEHTSELQSQSNLVCRLLLEKKKKQ